jgi:hypothetical protein
MTSIRPLNVPLFALLDFPAVNVQEVFGISNKKSSGIVIHSPSRVGNVVRFVTPLE